MINAEDVPRWRLYERVAAALHAPDADGQITVVPNAKLTGSISGVTRQVDVLVDARVSDDVSKRVIVDAKLRKRPIDVRDIETFEGMMKDCRASRGIIICAAGFTPAAERRAQQAITISLVPASEVDRLDVSQWDVCSGRCAGECGQGRTRGWVLYDQVFSVDSAYSPASLVAVGKCDQCGDFHVWCWDCGSKFPLVGNEAEGKCECERFWLTAVEDEGADEQGNELKSVLLLVVSLPHGAWSAVDRRPLA